MATKKTAAKLHLLTVRQVLSAADGDHSDGGGLLLRVRADACSWVLRFTTASGRRREMGLGVCRRGSLAQAGGSLTSARDVAHRAREQLRQGLDPIDERDRVRGIALQADLAKKTATKLEHWTLARSARDYHKRVIESTRPPST